MEHKEAIQGMIGIKYKPISVILAEDFRQG